MRQHFLAEDTGKETFAPVAKVWVSARDASGNEIGGSYTDERGYYAITDLPPGSYKLHFSPNYWYFMVPEWWSNKFTEDEADAIVVGAGEIVAEKNAVLEKERTIEGSVKVWDGADPQVEALRDAAVTVYSLDGEPVAGSGVDKFGHYKITGLVPDKYLLKISTYGLGSWATQWYSGKSHRAVATPVDITGLTAFDNINFFLAKGSSITGILRDDTGTPRGEAAIEVIDASGDLVDTLSTQSDGSYSIANLASGSYRLKYSASESYGEIGTDLPFDQWFPGGKNLDNAGTITVAAGSSTTAPSFSLVGGATIAGTVKGTATPATALSGISVTAEDASGTTVSSATTSTTGTYFLAKLSPGTYTVRFDVPENSQFTSQTKTVTVTQFQKLPGQDMVLKRSGASISGKVTGTAGIALSGVTVDATPVDEGSFPTPVTTDETGAYTLTALSPGSYRLHFAPAAPYLPEYYDDATAYYEATLVRVTTDQVVTGKNVSLVVGSVISGNVKGAAKTPVNLAGAKVELYSSTYNYWPLATTSTDASGNYSFPGLAADSYTLKFSSSGNYVAEWFNDKTSYAGATFVSVAVGKTLGAQNAVLSAGGQISGNVTGKGATSVNLPGVTVTAYPATGSGNAATAVTTTDASGNYTLAGLPVGSYALQYSSTDNYLPEWFNDQASFTAATRVAIAAGANASGKNVVLTAGASISGVITGVAGASLAGVEVDVYTAKGQFLNYAYSDSAGRYTLTKLPAGSYSLRINSWGSGGYEQEWYNDKSARVASDPIVLTAGQTATGKNVALVKSSSISGNVTSSGATPVNLAGIKVSLIKVSVGYSVGTAYTDSSGNYTLAYVNPGTYTLRFERQGAQPYADQWWEGKSSLAASTRFDVTSGQSVTGKNAKLMVGGAIAGVVTSATALPLAGVTVDVYSTANVWLASATTAADGSYTISGLSSGNYKLKYTPATRTNYLAQYFGGTTIGAATTVTVAVGATAAGKNVSLKPGATVTGVLTVSGKAPTTTWGSVTAYDTAGVYLASASVDSAGAYSLTGLAPGFVKLQFSAGGFATSYSTGRTTLGTADKISVTAGKPLTGANANLVPFASISGTITNSDKTVGSPVGGYTRLSLYTASGAIVTTTGGTAGTGAYTIPGLQAGSYRLVASPSVGTDAERWYGNTSTLESSTLIVVAAGQAVTGKDITLVKGSTLRGNIKGGTSPASLVGATVDVLRADGSIVSSASSDSSGNFTVTGVPAGTYTVRFRADGYSDSWWNGKTAETATSVKVGVSQNLTGFNTTLPSTATGSISGVQTDAKFGTGVVNGNRVQAFTTNGTLVATTSTEGDGGYVFAALPAGSYKIAFGREENAGYAVEWFGGKPTLATATVITVAANQSVTGQNIARRVGASIGGTVIDSSSPGKPVEDQYVEANNLDGSLAGWDYTDANGNYSVSGLPAGSYKILFSGLNDAKNLAPQWWPAKTTLETATAVTVTTGQTVTGRNATLSRGASLAGIVTNLQGERLDGISVPIWQKTGTTYKQVGTTETDGTGSYSIPGLSAGSYKVGFSDYSTGNSYDGTGGFRYADQFSNGKKTLAAADPITVSAASVTTAKTAVLANKTAQSNLTAAAPTITGTAAVGQTLKAVTSGWSPTGISFTYQWKRANLPLGTGASYVVTAADVGSAITVTVTGSKAGYHPQSKDSAATPIVAGKVLTAAPVPTITGGAKVGQKLTAAAGTWAPSGVTLAYQWLAGGTPIAGATAASYTLTNAAAGAKITVRVTGAKTGYATVSRTSTATAAVTGGSLTVRTPTITGTAKVGQKLTVAAGAWGPSGVTLAYQWNRAGVAIAGAKSSTYTLVTLDAGKTVTVTVTGSKTGYTTATKSSVASALVTGGTLTARTPAITGTAKVGQKLTAAAGAWAPSGVTLAYQWNRAGVAIPGAKSSTYTAVSLDVGKTITVSVTGLKKGFDSKRATSAATVKVAS